MHALGAVRGAWGAKLHTFKKYVLVISVALVPALVAACQQSNKDAFNAPVAERMNDGVPLKATEDSARQSGVIGDTETNDNQGTAEPPKRIVQKGSGVFLNQVPRRAEAKATDDGNITLNFVSADIREVLSSVLGDILQRNYSVAPSVAGTMTLQTSRPLNREAVLSTLESVLQLNGLALIEDEDLLRVVPLEIAVSQGPSLSVSTDGEALKPGYSIRLIPLRYVSASEMEKIIRPMVTQGVVLKADPERNILIVAAPRPQLQGIEEAVSVFDVDWLKGMSFAVLPLEYADPETVVESLNNVLPTGPDGPLEDVLRLVPLKRLSAVLVISTQPQYLDRAQALITNLDRGASGSGRELFVYYVQNGRAADLAETLASVFGAKSDSGTGGRIDRSPVAPRLEPGEISISRSSLGGSAAAGTGPSSQGSNAQQRQTDVPQTTRRDDQNIGQSARGSAAFNVAGETDQIRIVADPSTNAVLIWASPSDSRMVRDVLEKLDLVPLQVLIEATIAEVTLTDELRYGVQWFLRSNESSLTLSSSATNNIQPTFPGFAYVFSGSDVRAVLDALESVTELNVISSPTLMVLDNQTATLQVGDQVPVLSRQIQQTGSDAPIVNSVEFRDTGIILEVTPRVNANGLVLMEIAQEASQVTQTTTSGIDSPTIQQRLIRSSVAVQSGESVALGGLIRDQNDTENTGVPGLKDVPILGFFFGGEARTNKRTELLVMITPRAIRNQEEVRAVTKELRDRIRSVKPLREKIE